MGTDEYVPPPRTDAPAWGWLADHTGRREHLLRLAAGGALLASVGFFAPMGYTWVAVVTVLLFVCTAGVIPINMSMRVGAVAETITVTGETPIVDTQSARRQSVLSNDTINALPATRTYGALLSALPGLQVQGNGSAAITPR